MNIRHLALHESITNDHLGVMVMALNEYQLKGDLGLIKSSCKLFTIDTRHRLINVRVGYYKDHSYLIIDNAHVFKDDIIRELGLRRYGEITSSIH